MNTIAFRTVANPGFIPGNFADPNLFLAVAVGVGVLLAVAGFLIWMSGADFLLGSLLVGLFVGSTAALLTVPLTGAAEASARRDRWESDTQKFLTSEFGFHIGADDLTALELGDTVVVTYRGDQTAIKFSRAAGNKLAVLTTADRPLEAVAH